MAVLAGSAFAPGPDVRDAVRARIHSEYPALRAIYEQLHAHPELSFMEVNTAALMARELRALGIDVTEKVGRMGVVGVLRERPRADGARAHRHGRAAAEGDDRRSLRQHRGGQGLSRAATSRRCTPAGTTCT